MRPAGIVQAALALILAATAIGSTAFARPAGPEPARKAYVLSEITPHDRDAYRDYQRRVPMFIPRWGQWRRLASASRDRNDDDAA